MPKPYAVSLRELLRATAAEIAAIEDGGDESEAPNVHSCGLTPEQRSRLIYDVEADLARRTVPRIARPSEPAECTGGDSVQEPVSMGDDQLSLFDNLIAPHHRFFHLHDLVRDAWLGMFCTWPEDHVIVNPLLNREFIARCRAFGAQVSEEQLNWTLLNLRKAGRLTGAKREQVDALLPEVADKLEHACEIAGRCIQLLAFKTGRMMPTIDRILCSPTWRSLYDERVLQMLPNTLVPQQEQLLYLARLGLLRFRKSGRESSQKRGQEDLPIARFHGPLDHLDPERVPNEPGIYEVFSQRRCVFLGHTIDLRARLRNHIAISSESLVPPDWDASFGGVMQVSIRPSPSIWTSCKVSDVAAYHKFRIRPVLNLLGQVA